MCSGRAKRPKWVGFFTFWGPKASSLRGVTMPRCALTASHCVLSSASVACMVTAIPQPCRVINPIGLDGEIDPKAEASPRQSVRPYQKGRQVILVIPLRHWKVVSKLHTGFILQVLPSLGHLSGDRSIALQLLHPQVLSLRACTIDNPGNLQNRVLVFFVFHCRSHSTKCLV